MDFNTKCSFGSVFLLLATFVCVNGKRVAGMDNRAYECPAGFIRIGSSCYLLSTEIATWQEALFNCHERSRSQLATLHNRWQDRNLQSMLNRPEAARLERWIGGIYNWVAQRWIWAITGQAMHYHGFSQVRATSDNRWHCALMDPRFGYKWGTGSCFQRRHYICSLPLRNVGARS